MASNLKILAGHLELCGLLREGLETAAREILHTMELQDAMARELSAHAMSLAGEAGHENLHVAGMISALQSDDLIRQRQVAVTNLLAGLVAAIGDMTEQAGQDLESGAVSVAEVRQRWIAAITEMQSLAEIRERVASNLGSGQGAAA